MIKRIAAAISAALVLAIGGTGAALASNGADDPPGHHQEHNHGHKGKGHHHHHHGKADGHGKGEEPGDDHGGKGNQPGDDEGGKAEEAPAPNPVPGEYGY